MTAFELAVQDAAGIAVAGRVRPDRVELASALSTGGLTPSIGLIRAAVDAGLEVHVLVRPRLGGFEYSATDRALIVADARAALDAGAAGVVVGGTRDGRVDIDVVRAVQDIAGDAEITFHRAFDTVADRPSALSTLAGLGVTRVLTSGGATSAADALDDLRALHRLAAGAVQIMAGAGVDASNARAVAATGVDALHASARRTVIGTDILALGSDPDSSGGRHETTDETAAIAIRDALSG
ncbi:copper homeostasis protein [Labedella gwakjiensis]|uniref:PF03932 family protein CutC n=1 Tax=Labedella gwakjiensis TaxID=390269 RepID=A0A2P8GR76_9MICO|nr:copper homeostasis protein CutC [Labedella gwakjiensis]PSL36452.1 copper homeostasis protein [Labedella gwakjiensis]